MSSMRFIFALVALSAIPAAFAQTCSSLSSGGCNACTSNLNCVWCSSNQFQDLTSGFCQSSASICSTGSQASGSGACDLVGAVNNIANTIRIIIIVIVVIHVVNLAAITFAAHKTGRKWYVGFILGIFFDVFGWCCFCCIQPQTQTIVVVQQPGYGQPAYGQPAYGQPAPNPYGQPQ